MTNSSIRKSLDQIALMHTTMRPHGTKSERRWSKHWVGSLPGAYIDVHGNYHVPVGDSPSILWSCHTDTVHRHPGTQRIVVDYQAGEITTHPLDRASNCLGADDTAGVWLMRELVKRKVPGHYIFHYGEESGGIGSRAIAKGYAVWLKSFKCAIALDRRGYSDVITHQSYGRTASDLFAQSLADILGGTYSPCDTGLYTDTAEYADDIAECTNLSVGYFGAHTSAESLDCYHLMELLEKLALVRVEDLTIARTPGDWDRKSLSMGLSYGWDDADWGYYHDRDCDSAARKYANDGVAIYSSGTAGDKSSTVSTGEWECCYCFEINHPDDNVCDWCGKSLCDDCIVEIKLDTRKADKSRAETAARAMYLDPDMYEVHKALNTPAHECTCMPLTVNGYTIHKDHCMLRPLPVVRAVTSPACNCDRTRDERGVFIHSLSCSVTQAITK